MPTLSRPRILPLCSYARFKFSGIGIAQVLVDILSQFGKKFSLSQQSHGENTAKQRTAAGQAQELQKAAAVFVLDSYWQYPKECAPLLGSTLFFLDHLQKISICSQQVQVAFWERSFFGQIQWKLPAGRTWGASR